MPTLSFHTSGENAHLIKDLALQQGLGVSAFLNQLVEEGLKMHRFPGIVFRAGATGRRAALAGSLDIWEVMAILQDCGGDEAAAQEAYPNLSASQLRLARAYSQAYPDEIAQRLRMNQAALDSSLSHFPSLFRTG